MLERFKKKLIIIRNKDTLTLSGAKKQEYYDVYDNQTKEIYYKALIDFIKDKGRYVDSENLNNILKNEVRFEDNKKETKPVEMIDKKSIKKLISKINLRS